MRRRARHRGVIQSYSHTVIQCAGACSCRGLSAGPSGAQDQFQDQSKYVYGIYSGRTILQRWEKFKNPNQGDDIKQTLCHMDKIKFLLPTSVRIIQLQWWYGGVKSANQFQTSHTTQTDLIYVSPKTPPPHIPVYRISTESTSQINHKSKTDSFALKSLSGLLFEHPNRTNGVAGYHISLTIVNYSREGRRFESCFVHYDVCFFFFFFQNFHPT
jgi:hypothetical protein